MNMYKIEVTETLRGHILMMANSSEEALSKASDAHRREDFMLDYTDRVKTDMEIISVDIDSDEDEKDGTKL